MNKLLEHRGPDSTGVFKFRNIVLGHTRLSIQDLSENAHQPMTVDNKLWIIFNGEIYNFKEIKETLISKGYKFKSSSDTEVILNSYYEWGIDCLDLFNGMFVFSILDTIKNELIICRDRYGVKPCYIFQDNSKFIFSSEIKPIIAITKTSLDPNKLLIDDFKKEGLSTTDYKNIEILNPGHFLKINLAEKKIIKKRWWYGLNNIQKMSPNREEIKNELREILFKSIKYRLISDVKISTSLSGGIDSSIIFSELCKIEDANINLNPFIVNYPGNLTYDFAVNFAKSKGKEAKIINSDAQISIDDIYKTFATIEKKSYFPKQIDLYKSQKDNGFKVSIDGHGADECLGGYKGNISDFYKNFTNNQIYSMIAYNNISNENDNDIHNSNLSKGLKNFDLKKFLISKINSHYLENNIINFTNASLEEDILELKNFEIGFQSLYMDATYGNLPWLLNKWDRASMRSSVEIRSPFLDWNFFQFALSIPSHHKIFKGKNKSILRDAYANELPENINNFHNKQGLGGIKKNNYQNLILKNSLSEKDFIESQFWDSKKLLNDINQKNLDQNKKTEIYKICETYIFDKSMHHDIKNLQ